MTGELSECLEQGTRRRYFVHGITANSTPAREERENASPTGYLVGSVSLSL